MRSKAQQYKICHNFADFPLLVIALEFVQVALDIRFSSARRQFSGKSARIVSKDVVFGNFPNLKPCIVPSSTNIVKRFKFCRTNVINFYECRLNNIVRQLLYLQTLINYHRLSTVHLQFIFKRPTNKNSQPKLHFSISNWYGFRYILLYFTLNYVSLFPLVYTSH